jgi:hypothetical protein
MLQAHWEKMDLEFSLISNDFFLKNPVATVSATLARWLSASTQMKKKSDNLKYSRLS